MKCTYCDGTNFFEGPSGGGSVNVLCSNPDCRHWFNDMGPMGFEDLHKVEPTDEEKIKKQENIKSEASLAMDERYREGWKAYKNDKHPEVLRMDARYGGYAEASHNIDRLWGWLMACKDDIDKIKKEHE